MMHFRYTVLALLVGAMGLHANDAKEIIEATGIHGGLVVHVGCGDGKLTTALKLSNGYLVQGLDTSAANVAKARAQVRSTGLYGKVSISHWDGKQLPYIDNLVNLLVVQTDGLAKAEMLRVLAPQGVAYIQEGGQWRKVVKPRPHEMDDWTHYMYNAAGNPVSNDTLVAPPVYQQWVGGPRWSRHHDHMPSMNAMVSCDGKLFYVFDEGATSSIMLPSKWKLIARDAFNGVVLWKKSIPEWWTRFGPLKSGPAQLPRRLVAGPGRLYTTLSLRDPVSKLDSATGKILATYKGTENTWELVVSDGLLFVVTGSARVQEEHVERDLFAKAGRAPGNPINQCWKGWKRKLFVIETATDTVKWTFQSIILPGTLAADSSSIYFHNGKCIVSLDKRTGEKKWTSDPVASIDITHGIPTGFMPSLGVSDGVVVFIGGSKFKQHMKCVTDKTVGFSAKTGKRLWEVPHYPSGYQSPQDLFVANNTVISPYTSWQSKRDPMLNHVVGTDLQTGKKLFDNVPDLKDPTWFIHHRCHPAKATKNYLLLSKEGVEFLDLKTKKWKINHWVRGECLYGIMPANGLLYAPMHDCACSADMKLNGLNALAAPTTRVKTTIDMTTSHLTKGPAYGKPKTSNPQEGDWPTFRYNPGRTGVTPTRVPSDLKKGWSAKIGGKLTAPVVASGMLFVAAVNQHTLYALNEKTGRKAWTFATEGRIDSPPTIYNGLVLFGSNDGCVYCLRATDGELVWKLRAIAQDRRLMAWEQIESVWPVHGSVLVRNGEVWFTAGRSAFLDGGLVVFRVKPETGTVVSRARIDGKGPGGRLLTGAEEANLVGLSDILVASGDEIFMRSGSIKIGGKTSSSSLPKEADNAPSKRLLMYTNGARFCNPKRPPATTQKHLFSSYGFLDDSWFHRSYWVYGVSNNHGPGYFLTTRTNTTGRIMVHDKDNVYGFGREQKYFNWTSALEYRIFAESKKSKAQPAKAKQPRKKKRRRPKSRRTVVWQKKAPILSTGLVLAGDTLFTGGAPDVLNEQMPGIRQGSPAVTKAIREQDAALAGKRGGVLMAFGKTDGAAKQQYKIDAPPVWDGLIAANGKLFLVLKNGTVQCWSQK